MSDITWSEDLPLELKGTMAAAFAKPSEKTEYRINKAVDGTYWVVALVANEETGKGTINYHLGEALNREVAEELAAKDWQGGSRP
jgi:hypothetical protein